MWKIAANSLILLLVPMLCMPGSVERAVAQDGVGMIPDRTAGPEISAAVDSLVYVRIETNYPEALLFVDSTLVGALKSDYIGIPSQTEILRLSPPKVSAWSIESVEHELDARAGDSISVTLNFPYHYRIESIPHGASVHVEQATGLHPIGSTPLVYESRKPASGTFLVEHPGFAKERIEPGDQIWNRYVIELSPAIDRDAPSTQIDWEPPQRRRVWIDYAALGTAIVAGAVAIHYKFKADDIYDEYRRTGDPGLRPEVKRYDVRSGIAFGVMQAGIGVFALRLVLR